MLGGIGLVFAVATVWGLPSFDPPSGDPAVAMSLGPISARGPQDDDAETGAAPPPLPPIEEKLGLRTVNLVLEAGNTLLAALTKTGISYNEAYGASENLKTMLDLRTLKVGQTITLTLRPGDDEKNALHLESLAMVRETDRLVVVEHQQDEQFRAKAQAIEHMARLVSVTGEIETSLYEAAYAQDVPMPILLQAYQTAGHAVDLQRDIRKGNVYTLGYESFDDGENGGVHPGKLLYMSLTLGERTLTYVRYTTSAGYTTYFDEDGRSVETSLIRTPVDGGRLSSLFGKRDHPVLGFTRMHNGLDFAAPRGAPVLAAGNGIVARRSRYGSFGKFIRIEHDGSNANAYAHLSRYAKGLKPGDRVRQGDVIGYVGATGLATGPNLHYEVQKKGRQVNPTKLELPSRRVLKGDELGRFRQATAKLLSALDPAARSGDAQEAAAAEPDDSLTQ